jgi:hypothetical protein
MEESAFRSESPGRAEAEKYTDWRMDEGTNSTDAGKAAPILDWGKPAVTDCGSVRAHASVGWSAEDASNGRDWLGMGDNARIKESTTDAVEISSAVGKRSDESAKDADWAMEDSASTTDGHASNDELACRVKEKRLEDDQVDDSAKCEDRKRRNENEKLSEMEKDSVGHVAGATHTPRATEHNDGCTET